MLWWVFQNVVVAAALALIVAMVCRFVRPGPVIQHALWVVVLLKFVTPPLIVWPWTPPDPFGLAAPAIMRSSDLTTDARDRQSVELSRQRSNDDWPQSSRALSVSTDPLERSAAEAVVPWVLAFWILGSVVMLSVEVARITRLARRMRDAVPAGREIQDRIASLAERLGLRPVPVLALSGITSPMIWCFGRPRMLWPSTLDSQFTTHNSEFPVCVDGVLVHELAHVKRRDHLVGWLELVAGVIWWWNPLFWYVRSSLREQAELACDAWVISALPNGRRAYAESLLALSGATARGNRPISMAAVIGIRAGNRRVLERRLVMIMQGRAPLRLSLAGFFSLIIIAALSLPAWAVEEQAPQPAPAPQGIQATRPAPVAQPAPAGRPAPQAAPPREHPGVHPATTHPTQRPAPAARPGERMVEVTPQRLFPTTVPERAFYHVPGQELPEDGKKLLLSYEADRDAILAEANKKTEERRATLLKQMQALQDQYTKAGKLDEALAVRDFIRSGAVDAWHTAPGWIRR